MDSSPVLAGFGRWLKGGRMLSAVLNMLPPGKCKPRSPPPRGTIGFAEKPGADQDRVAVQVAKGGSHGAVSFRSFAVEELRRLRREQTEALLVVRCAANW